MSEPRDENQQYQPPAAPEQPPAQPPPLQPPAGQAAAPPPQQGPPPGYYQQPGPPPQWQSGPPPGAGWQPHRPGGPPPWQAPPPRRMKRSPIGLIIGLIVLIFVGGGALITFIGAGVVGSGFSLPFGQRIALLEVEGVLGEGVGYGADTARLKNLVLKWAEDDSIKGMVVRVNSPGGAVSATHDLYEAIEEFRAQNKPVYASMGDVAASGGYYVSMGADRVYANGGTITGSIGVILSFWGYQDLVEKIGLEPRTIKSGEFKDIGSGARPLTEKEKALLDEMVSDVYEDFFSIVLQSRSDSAREVLASGDQTLRNTEDVSDEDVEAHLREYADGRIFSGNQAVEYGFVDEIGTLDDVVEAMRTDLGLPEGTGIVHTPKPQPSLFGIVKQKAEALGGHQAGMAKMEYRFQM